MRIHCLQHVAFEGPGSVLRWARQNGHDLTRTRMAEGERLPSADAYDMLVIMGGPMSVHDVAAHPWIPEEMRFIGQAIAEGKRVLGICLGAQMIASVLGARVQRNPEVEIGWFPVRKAADARRSEFAQALPDEIDVLHWHNERFDLPRGAVHLMTSEACANQAFAYLGRVLGLQFHLEMNGDGAQDLIRYCGQDLIEAPFVQRPESILWEPQRFDRANAVLDRLLDHLSRAAG